MNFCPIHFMTVPLSTTETGQEAYSVKNCSIVSKIVSKIKLGLNINLIYRYIKFHFKNVQSL